MLYVLQQEDVDAAVSAQSHLQHFFSLESFTNAAASNISLGGVNMINLLGFTIDVGNGTVGSAAANISRRSGDEGGGARLARLY